MANSRSDKVSRHRASYLSSGESETKQNRQLCRTLEMYVISKRNTNNKMIANMVGI